MGAFQNYSSGAVSFMAWTLKEHGRDLETEILIIGSTDDTQYPLPGNPTLGEASVANRSCAVSPPV